MTKSRDLGNLAQTVAVNLPTSLGTASQILQVNAGATALEFSDASGPTTTQVLTATAGASTGAVGTYAFLLYNSTNVSWLDGANIAGSNLRKSTISGNGGSVGSPMVRGSTNGTPSGTWKALTAQYANSGYTPYGLFLRVS